MQGTNLSLFLFTNLAFYVFKNISIEPELNNEFFKYIEVSQKKVIIFRILQHCSQLVHHFFVKIR